MYSVEFVCPSCAAFLLGGLDERQYLDIIVRCTCEAYSATPSREFGEPITLRSVVPLERRIYRITIGGFEPKSVMMVGARAFEEYALETGKRSVDSPMPPLGGTLGGPDLLRTQADQIVALLGSRYDTLVARHRRGHHHRLIELEHYARELARYMQFVPGTIDADPVKLSEMAAITSLFERWKHHPAIPELIDSQRSAEEVRHTIAVLTLSSFLVDHENGVGIFRRSSRDGRVADLWLAVTLIARLEIEVKAPQTLLGPLEQTLTYANAHRIVKAAFDNAASIDKTRTA
jgi:hypothetical protein